MRIHANMKMADLVHINFELLAVLQRLQIPFGFKDKSVATVCKESGVEVDFFLALTQWFLDRKELPQAELMHFPPNWIIGYLQHTHSCYLTYQIPRLEKEIEQLDQIMNTPDQSAQLMSHFFKEYIREFSEHIEEEEKIAFPYILEVEKVVSGKLKYSDLIAGFGGYSIQKYLDNHTDLEEKILDLQNILLKYVPPPSNNCHFTNLLVEIYRLGQDLKDHTLLEENVLIPQVKAMERTLAKMIKPR